MGLNEPKHPILSSILPVYTFINDLHVTNSRTNYEQFSLKICEKLRSANLNLNFTGSFKKECTFLQVTF